VTASDLVLERAFGIAPPLRVASIPADHVYVRHLTHPIPDSGASDRRDLVRRLSDPTTPWWPPAMLDPDWVRAHADDFDVFHIHFGFDACAPDLLRELVAVLRQYEKPLVQTVHDLRNPHHQTAEAHDEHLDILIPAADALITLTPGAAEEIERGGAASPAWCHIRTSWISPRCGSVRYGLRLRQMSARRKRSPSSSACT